ncbi:hypothetical protein [Sharpea azabuensis]|uniref:hypothetical protein n=1 Tax=Sharpea azabuensis TaxID=322505 RepID=UPI00051B2AEF|nr:hypothetical protein [Sharpea azabuensis]
MKKLFVLILSVFMLMGCSSKTETISLKKPVTIAFYSIADCGECKAFKKNAIPYFKKVFGKQVTIKMYDMDATSTKTHYDTAINRLAEFDQEYYGMGPFIDIEGYFSYLGYRAGDEEAIAKDIHNAQYDKKLTSTLEGHRFSYKS